MKKLVAMAVLMVLICSGLLFAAGEKEGATAKPTLVVSSRLYSQPDEQRFLIDEIFPEFEAEYNCIVKFDILTDDNLLKRARFQKETEKVTTDVIIAGEGIMKELMKIDYVDPLPEWEDRTWSQAFSANISSGGKTYFAPVGGDVYLLLANKKALPYLPDGADIQALSWEEYVEWANAMADGEGEGKTAVTGIPQKSLVYMYGGMFLSYGGPFPIVNSPGAIEGWKLLTKMQNAYTPAVMTYDNVSSPMKTGESWLTVAHMVRCGNAYKSNPSNYVIAPAPSGPEGIGSIAGTSGFALVKDAPNAELAEDFVEYMTEPSKAVEIARGTGGFIPPIEEAINQLGDSIEDEIISKGLYVLKKGVVSGVPGDEYTSWGAVKQVYDDIFKEMIIEKGELDLELLDQAQARIEALKK